MTSDQIGSLTLPSGEVARTLQMGVATVNRWAKAGTLPAYQVGHSWIVLQAQFQAWLKATADASVQIPSLPSVLASLPPILRVDEVGQLLHVSDATVRTLIEERALGAYDLGAMFRVPRGQVMDYFARSGNSFEPERSARDGDGDGDGNTSSRDQVDTIGSQRRRYPSSSPAQEGSS